jgi:hypothetical protein
MKNMVLRTVPFWVTTAPVASVTIDGPTTMSLLLVVTVGAVQKLPTNVTGTCIPAAAASGL